MSIHGSQMNDNITLLYKITQGSGIVKESIFEWDTLISFRNQS